MLNLTCAGLVEETRLGSGDCTYRRVESLGDRRQLGADDVDEAGAASQAAVSAEEQLQQVGLTVVSWLMNIHCGSGAGAAAGAGGGAWSSCGTGASRMSKDSAGMRQSW